MKRLVTYHRYIFHVPRGVNASAEVQAEGADPCVPQPQGRQRRVLSRTDQLIKDHIRQPDANEQRVSFVEIHGGSPGLEGLVPYIQAWRRLGQNHNKTFFAFTLVREPLAFALSYFKFFHAECSLRWCEHVQYKEYSPTNLLLSARAHANQQCFLLKHLSSIDGMHPSFYKKCRVTKADCNGIYDIMKRNLDWIGTTERMSNDTIPLLLRIVRFSGKPIDVQRKYNEDEHRLESPLNKSEKSELRSLSKYDQAIYDRVTKDYPQPPF